MFIDPTIFRAYDIRGKVGSSITEGGFRLIGQAFGTELRERYSIASPLVCVGRDARTHSLSLEKAITEGLLHAGCRVLAIGQTPTPLNYFTIAEGNLDGGIQVTASHNPPEDNGVKLSLREAEAFSGENLQDLRRRIEDGKMQEGKGEREDIDALTPYNNRLLDMFSNVGEGFPIVLDAGNGVAGPLFSRILKDVGLRVTELYCDPDGTFPNHPADPSNPETLQDLQREVMKIQARLGLAFDGDGDRLGIVDEQGHIRSADELLLLLSQDHLERHPGAPIVFTVSNSGVLESEIRKWGGVPTLSRVGHSFVEHEMRESGALLGGEQSGHFFCSEAYFCFDDALVATLHIVRILKEADKPLSVLLKEFPKVYQAPERRPVCPDGKKEEIIRKITEHFLQAHPVETLDGARVDFSDGAWAGIRQSNTSPCLSVCMEARSPEKLASMEEEVLTHLKSYPDISL